MTFCTFERREFFTRAEIVDCVRTQFLQTFREHQFALLAQVFMPDHTHLLVEGLSDQSDFRRAMMVARQRCTRACKRHLAAPSLWQDGYFERILRQDEQIPIAAYIVNNPVQAGMVNKPEDYAYVWSQFHPALKNREGD